MPAVTSVEEWTKAETGVGAAIAAGNHLEKGICALFVVAAIVSITAINIFVLFNQIDVKFQCEFIIHAIEIKIKTSPIRFVKAVSMPAAKDFEFW